MIRYNIPTWGQKVTINAQVFSENPIDLIISGRDISKSEVVYFKREINDFIGNHNIVIPMPITPNKLSLSIYDKNRKSSNEIEVSKIYASKLDFSLMKPYDTDKDKEYYVFMFWFCEHFKSLKEGVYKSEFGNFTIHYEKKLYELDGTVSTTPCRINRRTAEIDVSMDVCKDMTVYMMVMILLHEYFHWRLQSTDEQLVDSFAVRQYKAMGFPSSEALYSFTNVFEPESDKHAEALKQRTESLFSFLAKQPK